MKPSLLLWSTLLVSQFALSQIKPELPREYINTTYHLPGGKTWAAHSDMDFRTALQKSAPGDVIVLDAGTVYSGNFNFPAKTYSPPRTADRNQWIYIISSQMAELPAPGTRVDPNHDAAHMPKIVTPNATSALIMKEGSKYLRLAGIEMYSASTVGCQPENTPPRNCSAYQLVYAEGRWNTAPDKLPDYLTVDRCYLHGSPTQDVREGVLGNAAHLAVIDSYISDIHQSTFDSQAVAAYASPGPIKIVNNYLSATTEDVLFGGAGGKDNPYQPADIEIRNNHFYKPLAWLKVGLTLPPKPQWIVKNNLEFKSGRRVIVENNVFENNWRSGQDGTSIVLTVRTGQSGDLAVVDDILFQNNVIKNVPSGFSTLANDYSCGSGFPKCTNKGESKRVKITNNAIYFMDPAAPGGSRNNLAVLAYALSDYEFSHNSTIPAVDAHGKAVTCWASIFFNVPPKMPWPPTEGSITNNIWILDNALCRQPTGAYGAQGSAGLTKYMGDPPPLGNRLNGNVFFVPPGDKPQTWPQGNMTTQEPIKFTDDMRMVSPVWTKTTSGKQAGFQGN